MKKVFRWLKGLTGISTPIGGLSWSPSREKSIDIPTFDGTILLTSNGNDNFISFLDRNAGRIVFLKIIIDACVTNQEQIEFVETEEINLDALTSGSFSGQTFSLQNELGKIAYLVFHFTANHVLTVSFGGTGTVMIPLNGFFEVSPSLHGGPSTVYHLKEIDAPLEVRLEHLNSPTCHSK